MDHALGRWRTSVGQGLEADARCPSLGDAARMNTIGHTMKRRYWTTLEVRALRALYSTTTNKELGARFDRVPKAIALLGVQARPAEVSSSHRSALPLSAGPCHLEQGQAVEPAGESGHEVQEMASRSPSEAGRHRACGAGWGDGQGRRAARVEAQGARCVGAALRRDPDRAPSCG